MIEIHSTGPSDEPPARPLTTAMRRGFRQTCPACGQGKLYKSFLKVADACPACGEELHHHRADDAPPYFTIFIVAHFVGAGVMILEREYAPDTWVHYTIWLPMLLVMSMWLLPRIKGALVGLQWANRMHGFGGPGSDVFEVDATHETPRA